MNKDLNKGFMRDLHTSNENLTKGKRAEGDFIARVSFRIKFSKHWDWTESNADKEALRYQVLCV